MTDGTPAATTAPDGDQPLNCAAGAPLARIAKVDMVTCRVVQERTLTAGSNELLQGMSPNQRGNTWTGFHQSSGDRKTNGLRRDPAFRLREQTLSSSHASTCEVTLTSRLRTPVAQTTTVKVAVAQPGIVTVTVAQTGTLTVTVAQTGIVTVTMAQKSTVSVMPSLRPTLPSHTDRYSTIPVLRHMTLCHCEQL